VSKAFVGQYKHSPGGHCSSTAMRDLLSFYGHAFTEEMIFGLGCGIDFIYLRDSSMNPPVYIGGRVYDLEGNLARSLGFKIEAVSGLGSEESFKEIKKMLDQGIPVMVLADVYYLDYLRAKVHFSAHRIVIVGYDDKRKVAYVADNDRDSIQECSYESLNKARSSSFVPQPADNTFYQIFVPEKIESLDRAIPSALLWTAKNNLEKDPRQTVFNFGNALVSKGLIGLKKFATEMPHWKNEFNAETLTLICKSIYVSAEKGGTGYGGNFRRIYGRFLKESAHVLNNPSLGELGEEFIEIGNLWTHMCLTLKEKSANGAEAIESCESIASEIYQREREAFSMLERIAKDIQREDDGSF